MPEIRGTDLVVEYLIRERCEHIFGYAGHGAVGLLDGVFDHADEIRSSSRASSPAPATWPTPTTARAARCSRLHLDRPGPDAADRGDGQRVLRLLGVRRADRPGRDQPARLGRAAGGVPAPPGRLPEHRQGHHEAQLPGALRRRPRQVPAQGVQDRRLRPPRARCTSTSRTTSGSRRPMSTCRTRESARRCSTGARPARPRRSSARSTCC